MCEREITRIHQIRYYAFSAGGDSVRFLSLTESANDSRKIGWQYTWQPPIPVPLSKLPSMHQNAPDQSVPKNYEDRSEHRASSAALRAWGCSTIQWHYGLPLWRVPYLTAQNDSLGVVYHS